MSGWIEIKQRRPDHGHTVFILSGAQQWLATCLHDPLSFRLKAGLGTEIKTPEDVTHWHPIIFPDFPDGCPAAFQSHLQNQATAREYTIDAAHWDCIKGLMGSRDQHQGALEGLKLRAEQADTNVKNLSIQTQDELARMQGKIASLVDALSDQQAGTGNVVKRLETLESRANNQPVQSDARLNAMASRVGVLESAMCRFERMAQDLNAYRLTDVQERLHFLSESEKRILLAQLKKTFDTE